MLRFRKPLVVLGMVCVSGLVSLPAMAEDGVTEAHLRELENKINTLETQVGQLGSGLSSRQGDTGVPLHGFADVGLIQSNENNAAYGKGNKGFTVGSFDMYLAPQYGAHVRTLIEPNIEVDQFGNIGVDLERLQIGYVASDTLNLWGGRFHTPYGYWNTAFHHGAQIQTSVLRPRFLDFEDKGGILPAHTTGLWFNGVLPTGGNKFGYDVYVGNSQRIRTDTGNPAGPGGVPTGSLDMRMAGGPGNSAITGFNTWFTPASLSDLRIGIHAFIADISAVDATTNVQINMSKVQMAGAYAEYNNDNFEIMAEYYGFNNKDTTANSLSHNSSAWFGQVGYNTGLFTPYIRAERASLDQADPYFKYQTNGRSYDRSAIGLRFELDPRAALKLELNNTRKHDLVDASSGAPIADDNYNEVRVQYSVRF